MNPSFDLLTFLVNLLEPTCKIEVILIFRDHGGLYMHHMMYNEVSLYIFDQMLKKLVEEGIQDTHMN